MSKTIRPVELIKDVLIVLLVCSAGWLLVRSRLLGPLDRLWQKETPQYGTGQTQSELGEAVCPLCITAAVAGEAETVRFSAQYDEEACTALFRRTAGLMAEALASAGEPEPVDRAQWEQALIGATGVCYDFQGELPLSALAHWLAGETESPDTPVRRLLLADWQGTTALYYRDGRDGACYRCRAEVVDSRRLEEALSGLTDSGCFYAFESELYNGLDPDTLLTRDIPAMGVYSVSNPAAGGQSALETLAEDLSFSINVNGVYYAGEWVARSENDTLRLSPGGTLSFTAGEEGADHFALQGKDLFAALESCRRLASVALESRCGQARLYPSSVWETEGGWEIRFSYSLQGIPVQLEEGCAAEFLVKDGQILHFTMHLRTYTDSGMTDAVLPVRQAAAALLAEDLAGEELLLVYTEEENGLVHAAWAADTGR